MHEYLWQEILGLDDCAIGYRCARVGCNAVAALFGFGVAASLGAVWKWYEHELLVAIIALPPLIMLARWYAALRRRDQDRARRIFTALKERWAAELSSGLNYTAMFIVGGEWNHNAARVRLAFYTPAPLGSVLVSPRRLPTTGALEPLSVRVNVQGTDAWLTAEGGLTQLAIDGTGSGSVYVFEATSGLPPVNTDRSVASADVVLEAAGGVRLACSGPIRIPYNERQVPPATPTETRE